MLKTSNNKNALIAKNTIFLYIRMIFVMIVTLFTSRVVLHALGEEDYGCYNVVGGVVLLLSFLGSSISAAVSRYFSFEIGRSNVQSLNRYFVHSLYVFLFIALFCLIICETLGKWFVLNEMTIAENRVEAALWVFDFSVLSFIFQLLMIPYNSMIIAQEKMNIYAYVSIVECVLKLIIAYIILISGYDKLKVYATLMCLATFLSQGSYAVYCKYKYCQETKLLFFWDTQIFRRLISFSGWILFGTLSDICKGQGLNIIINMFFNPSVNAARAISYQINNSMNQFVNGFFTACRPQITKYYAQGEKENMMNLIFQSSRMCSYLFLMLSLPIIIKITPVLQLWLGSCPTYTEIFTKLVIVLTFVESMNYPLTEALVATGQIRTYQIVTGGLIIFNLPISFALLKRGFPPETTMYVSIVLALLAQISRIFFMMHYHKMSLLRYLNEVLIRIFGVVILSYVISAFLSWIIEDFGWLRLFGFGFCSIICTTLVIYTIGVSNNERTMINRLLLKLLIKRQQ